MVLFVKRHIIKTRSLDELKQRCDIFDEIWLNHFNTTVDENFTGVNAEKIKTQALSLATIMQIKIHQQNT